MKKLMAFAACAALLTACQPHKAAQPAIPVKYNTELAMPELMGHVVDPSSWVYWKGAGYVETAKGDVKLAPTTDEGWENLESAAATLIEAGNMLQLPGRARTVAGKDESDWNRFAQQLTAEAILAKAAAEKHDENGVYTEGAKLYQICTACHAEFVIGPLVAEQHRLGQDKPVSPEWRDVSKDPGGVPPGTTVEKPKPQAKPGS
jgi:hypothetical protein